MPRGSDLNRLLYIMYVVSEFGILTPFLIDPVLYFQRSLHCRAKGTLRPLGLEELLAHLISCSKGTRAARIYRV